MQKAKEQAKILIEALPYIKEHYGKTIVVKYGGKAMVDEHLKEMVATDIVLMKYVGINPVIVHGGGPEITDYMHRLAKEVKFVEGLRVTDKETMEIVKMVLVGKINKELVGLINRHGNLAVGVSGEDGALIVARKRPSRGGVDLGFVGEVARINSKIIEGLTKDDFIPVIASIGVDREGNSYNINADTVAGEIAAALKAEKIIFLTDVEGLYRNFEDKESFISEIGLSECQKLVKRKGISEGMLPKIEACIKALQAGVSRAHILDGRIEHALLLEIFTKKGIGTMIKRNSKFKAVLVI